ncbi:hypothetical protein BT96DRAFT_919764 [Gymnopus androsaceus JB14]|uniref:S-adenosyl-L-methionine-dependent methyltransferase n=1 Tax=Gymnopus androsaceus JB14 TaxID=1447944 RepID=A0A6A4HRM4_9AGAR|nr:hypothetical protein BT96DRAFT_919764 [Gymnopus androsaceus JB14]
MNAAIFLEIGSGSGCVTLDAIQTSFTQALHSRLKNSVDIICFNPPYVPTVSTEVSEAQDLRGIEGSWAGGSDGMQMTNIFLSVVHVRFFFLPSNRNYLVALKENNIPEIQSRMKRLHQLESKIVLSRRAGWEHLSIVRFKLASPDHK